MSHELDPYQICAGREKSYLRSLTPILRNISVPHFKLNFKIKSIKKMILLLNDFAVTIDSFLQVKYDAPS